MMNFGCCQIPTCTVTFSEHSKFYKTHLYSKMGLVLVKCHICFQKAFPCGDVHSGEFPRVLPRGSEWASFYCRVGPLTTAREGRRTVNCVDWASAPGVNWGTTGQQAGEIELCVRDMGTSPFFPVRQRPNQGKWNITLLKPYQNWTDCIAALVEGTTNFAAVHWKSWNKCMCKKVWRLLLVADFSRNKLCGTNWYWSRLWEYELIFN